MSAYQFINEARLEATGGAAICILCFVVAGALSFVHGVILLIKTLV